MNKSQHSNKKDRELKDHEGEWVGENLYYCWTSGEPHYKIGASSQAWYDEIKDYDFEKGESSNGGVVGHFTQLVWNKTKEVGFGLAFNGGSCFVVANYYPGGNFNNEEKNNVFPENIGKEKLEEIERKRKEEKEKIKFTPKNCNYELFNELEIKKHNELRKKHHVDDIILNKELMKIAQKHADKMAKTNNFSHSNKKDRELKNHKGEWVGENIYYFWSSGQLCYTSGDSTQSWYDEIKDYNFEKGESSNGGVVGHFTQVVWKNTKEAGFGLAFGKNECYVVGNYYPGGNFNNEEKNNVFPE